MGAAPTCTDAAAQVALKTPLNPSCCVRVCNHNTVGKPRVVTAEGSKSTMFAVDKVY